MTRLARPLARGVLLLAIPLAPCSSAGSPPNILLVVADDLSVTEVGAYAEGTDAAPTPHLDALAAGGVLFRNAWSNPTCSPTRATLMTGRYAFRTGIGSIVTPSFALAPSELILPEVLDLSPSLGYSHAAIGKWHLGNDAVGGLSAPTLAGFGHYQGTIDGVKGRHEEQNYYFTEQSLNGTPVEVEGYNTTVLVDQTVAWIQSASEPWFCSLFLNAPHYPTHAPPSDLHSIALPPGRPHEVRRPFFKAAVEAMDTELGRMLADLSSTLDDTVVIFIGDNGTPISVADDPSHAKASVFEGGINVPLIMSGPGIAQPGREVDALVNATDLFATVLELAGVDVASTVPGSVKLDSVSVVPYLADASQTPLRTHVFSELFTPNGFSPTTVDRVVRNDRYKLRRVGVANPQVELYDLQADPDEQLDLIAAAGGVGGLTAEQSSNYQSLVAALDGILGS